SRFARGYFGPIGLLCALGLLPGPAARAAAAEESFLEKPRAAFASKLELVQRRYAESLCGISNDFRTVLSRYAVAARADGRLREYQAAKQALDRFQAAGQIEKPDVSAESDYVGKAQRAGLAAQAAALRTRRIDEAKLRQAYVQFLEKSKVALTQQNRLVEVDEVDAEIEMVRAFLDPDVLAPPPPAARLPRTAPVNPPADLKPIATNRLVVVATCAGAPAAGLDVVLRSHSFNKTFKEKTDRFGRAEFRILPELEYMICVLDPKFMPLFQPECRGGQSYPLALEALPEDVHFLELPVTGSLDLPGISAMQICGYTARQGVVDAISLRTSSGRTQVGDTPAGQDSVSLPVGAWTRVAERTRALDVQLLVPTESIRIALYRELSPEPGPAAPGPAAVRPGPQPDADAAHLTVVAKNGQDPAQGVDVALYAHATGQAQRKKTDRTGTATFAVEPDDEYSLAIAHKRFEPYVKSDAIGGETYEVALTAMPKGVEMLVLERAGEFQLPGISPLQMFGFTGQAANIGGVYLRPTTIKTTFSGHAAGQDRILANVDEWMTVSERNKNVEFKILAPSGDGRIVLYRRLR
ncbi:MAG: carboxypeptidase-like regulatory domain-containing protein, partial [Kiritimatiellia bacterium]